MEFKEVVAEAAIKSSPPVTVGAMTLVGIPLSDLVLILTGVYLVLQIAFLVWNQVRKVKGKDGDKG